MNFIRFQNLVFDLDKVTTIHLNRTKRQLTIELVNGTDYEMTCENLEDYDAFVQKLFEYYPIMLKFVQEGTDASLRDTTRS